MIVFNTISKEKKIPQQLRMENYIIGFYLEKLYYIPHFEPVIKEIIKRDIAYVIIIPKNRGRDELNQREESIKYCQEKGFMYCLDEENRECHIMVFGNTPRHISTSFKKSALIMHGTWGGKTVNYAPDLNNVDLRFLDGKFMEDRLNELFPEKKSIYYISGYSKLDNYFLLTEEDRIKFLQSCNLDINKKTILYAPTFYPSSILKMGKKFPEDFAEYNIILKPHSHLFLRKRYRRDLHRLETWASYPNVYLAKFNETDILPFLNASDLMISDMSSAVFEFSGIGKPAIVNMFLRYRLHDRLFPHKARKRLDIENFYLWEVADTPKSKQNMVKKAREALAGINKNKAKREELVRYVMGVVDGKVSSKIVDKLLELNDNIKA